MAEVDSKMTKREKKLLASAICFQITLLLILLGVFKEQISGWPEFLSQFLIDDSSLTYQMSIVVAVIFLCFSNFLSKQITGWFKDHILWKRQDKVPNVGIRKLRDLMESGAIEDAPKDISMRQWWKKNGFLSNESFMIGYAERIIVTLAGLTSLHYFFVTCGAWVTIKTAIDWQMVSNVPYRVISHIYFLPTLLSLGFALIDVIFLRSVWGITILN